MFFDIGQKLPTARADIPLLDRSAVDGDRRDAIVERTIQNLKESVATLWRIIDPSSHLDRDWNMTRNDIPRSLYNLQCHGGLAQMKATATSSKHLTHRASEIDVYHRKARFDELLCSQGELFGLRAHQLTRDGMFFGRIV